MDAPDRQVLAFRSVLMLLELLQGVHTTGDGEDDSLTDDGSRFYTGRGEIWKMLQGEENLIWLFRRFKCVICVRRMMALTVIYDQAAKLMKHSPALFHTFIY